MSDNEQAYKPSTEAMKKSRNTIILCFFGGIILLVVLVLPLAKLWYIGLIIGVVICAIGAGWLLGRDKSNKKNGALILVVGIIVSLSKVPVKPVMAVMGTIVAVLAIGLLVMGIINLLKYFSASNR